MAPNAQTDTSGQIKSPWHNNKRTFLDADIDQLVSQLKQHEKFALLAGADWWHTVPIPRLDIPGVKVTDGPSGARGASFSEQTAGLATPCETALAATFNFDLVGKAGSLLAREAKDRGAVALLAPTTNIQRSPLGGRSFENFTEDPIYSGKLASAYINGLQDSGVSAVLKHFVANDIEHERMAVSAEVSERALREIYLRPFQIAIKDSNPLAIMTSYNRVNGTHVSESKDLLDGVLRKEWGWDGLIMSDWFGTYSTTEALLAGQDLEMPGPGKWRAPHLLSISLASRKLSERDIDRNVTSILRWAQRAARLSPDTVYGPDIEVTGDRPEDRQLLQELSANSCVLLKNEGNALPLTPSTIKRVAVVGPRSLDPTVFGGGSAQINTSYSITVLDGVRDGAPAGIEVIHAQGTTSHKFLPVLEGMVREDGNRGTDMRLLLELPEGSTPPKPDTVVKHIRIPSTIAFLNDGLPTSLEDKDWFGVMAGTWTAPITGVYQFSLSVCGRAKLYVNDELVVELWDTVQRPGETFFGFGSAEEFGTYSVEKGKQYTIRVDYSSVLGPRDGEGDKSSPPISNSGLRVGGFPLLDLDEEMAKAVELAKNVDAVVVAVGLSPEWESESYDRPNLALPKRTDELVAKIAAVNKRTIVTVQAGSAVAMPWVNDVAAVVQAWYGGNSAGAGLADVLYGKVNPSGKLPLSFPVREEDIAAHGSFTSANGKCIYAEDLAVGYKWFQQRKITPLFPFGHGLSYTTFEYSDLSAALSDGKEPVDVDSTLTVSLTVTNNGSLPGSHPVQVYLSPPATGLPHPARYLGGTAHTPVLAPGEKHKLQVTMSRRELAHWDDHEHCWSVEKGKWRVLVARDSLAPEEWGSDFEVKTLVEWTGL